MPPVFVTGGVAELVGSVTGLTDGGQEGGDAPALACRADLGRESGCVVGVGACLVPVVVGGQGGCEVDVECGFGADKRWVESGECVGEDRGGIGFAEAGECVAAPAGEVHGVERDVGAFVGCVAG